MLDFSGNANEQSYVGGEGEGTRKMRAFTLID